MARVIQWGASRSSQRQQVARLFVCGACLACGSDTPTEPSPPPAVATTLTAASATSFSGTVAEPLAERPAVLVRDQRGNPMAGVRVMFAVGNGGGILTDANVVTGGAGTAAVGSWILGSSAGVHTLTATAGTLSVTFTANAAPGAPANLIKDAGDDQIGVIGVAVGVPPAVRVEDTHGNGVPGVGVTFRVSSAGGSIIGADQMTDSDGRARVGSWTLATEIGLNMLTADAATLVPVEFSAIGNRPPDFALSGFTLTQAVQRWDGAIPLVAGGNPVLVNVYGSVDWLPPAGYPAPRLRLSVYHGATQVLVDEREITGAFHGFGVPIHQVVLPSTIVAPGLRVAATINPSAVLPEPSDEDNHWPRGGEPLDVAVADVPPLQLYFVPIHLSHGGSVGAVSAATLPEYLYATRQMHPVAALDATIGPVFSTDVDFGNGAAGAWSSVLQQLDVLRLSEGTARYYVGVLRPPQGVTFVQFGGFAYVPFDPNHAGPGTRTSAVVTVGWFNRQRQTTELVAHELAHTMSLRHAPCGGAAATDPGYPYPDGSIGAPGYDLFSFSLSNASLPQYYDIGSTRDVMSYCNPAWISDYHYGKLLDVRGTVLHANASTLPRSTTVMEKSTECECLLVWGTVEDGTIKLHPSFVFQGHEALPAGSGSYLLEGLRYDGSRVFSYRFEPASLDHAPSVRHFTFAIPLPAVGRSELARILVSGDGSQVQLSASLGRSLERATSAELDAMVTLHRTSATRAELRWRPTDAAAVLVRDVTTRAIAGIATSGVLVLPHTPAEVEVILTDGVQSRTLRVRAD